MPRVARYAFSNSRLWNTVEKGEKRVDAQLAREFILALPQELSADAQFQTAADCGRGTTTPGRRKPKNSSKRIGGKMLRLCCTNVAPNVAP